MRGNQTTKTGASGQYAYTYDEENRLIRVTQGSTTIAGYWYDASGNRVRSVENGQTIYYVYDGLNVIQEDNVTSGIRTDHIYASSTRIAEKQGSTVRYYHGDHLGSTRVVTDAAGTKVADLKYAPYGSTIAQSGSYAGSVDYRFTGKQQDSGTGLYYFGARYYDPELGRFITQDPARDGVNWYQYANSNPLRFIDVLGFAAGDLFKSMEEAALDSGLTYNDDSIRHNREYGASIYLVEAGSDMSYSYTVPRRGSDSSVRESTPRDGVKIAAGIHTHGAFVPAYRSDSFSDADEDLADKAMVPEYLCTPAGYLMRYDPSSWETTVVSTQMPSDPDHPFRVNEISPHENPVDDPVQSPISRLRDWIYNLLR